MTTQKFASVNKPISVLVEQIESGELGLPDLQRPFVWKRSRIRDLFDSLYRGYPAGYLLFWRTANDVDSHAIGTDTKRPQQNMIVDGQQRLTSLYAVVKGRDVINEHNEQVKIQIAFNPVTEEFEVANAATKNNAEYISNITEVWSNTGLYKFIGNYFSRLREDREVSSEEENLIGERLNRLHSILNYQFSALELSSELEVHTVAEIFQRINSGGVALNSADFILTLMSVHRTECRHRLEDFSRAAKVPSTSEASPYNHFHSPSPDELLRVAVGLGLNRGVLQQAYQILRGRDPKTRIVSEETRNANFDKLEDAEAKVLNITSWHDYMLAVKGAGFLGRKMLTSTNNFLYGYLFYLIGKHRFNLDHRKLRKIISRWFFMSAFTGRYTGSPETILESDLRKIDNVSDGDGFLCLLNSIIETQFTPDFWQFTVPDYLESSSAYSPYLFAYHASLNLLGAKALFSDIKISELLAPDIKNKKSLAERHHLFPKAYLAKIGISGSVRSNQIANYAFVEWADNIKISDKAPADYFPAMLSELSNSRKNDAVLMHALPERWYEMDYNDFLKKRRRLISDIIKRGFDKISEGGSGPSSDALPTIDDLLRLMETLRVEFKSTARKPLNSDVPEKVINESIIKTIGAFMNTEGGTLGIGITDDGDILGIQPDLDYKRQDIDGYHNWLSTLLMNALGDANTARNVSIRFETDGDKVVCLVDVKRALKPVYADSIKGKGIFYIRVGNTTRTLMGNDLVEYVNQHF